MGVGNLCGESSRSPSGKAFHREGEAFLKERSENFSLEVNFGCARRRPFDDERVEPAGWI